MQILISGGANSGKSSLAEQLAVAQYYFATMQGNQFSMAGLLSGMATMGNRLCRFGYVTMTAQQDTLCAEKGAVIRAHSFHYADSTENGTAFSVQRPNGRTWLEVQQQGSILAGFPHWYFPSCPEAAQRFAEQCRRYQKRRNTGCRF